MTEADLRQILSKNIKSLRSLRSLSQSELAEKADISIPFLSNIERALKWPHPETLVRLAQALDVEVYMLFKKKIPAQPVDVRNILAKYKKDVSVALHKTVLAAIENSLEIISSHYIDNEQ
ncbi:MAG: helix-turn-helix domain-containing protein [Treponema sp.]|jgi:transcriptional regulator with XRE-family HTH domain|nr:helix-turn-helix domain-containing protein [Treponema sp.]